jgi:putative ABC transport system ATP-binding protein/lipoprotein-releasing system ATP-binding protein
MGITASQVGKVIGNPETRVLSGISFSIEDGEFVALTGKSGSGKSTLLYLLSTLDHPTEGKIEISGMDVRLMEPEALHVFRNQKVGFVFQFHYLIAELNMIENVLMPAFKFDEALKRKAYAEFLLEQFGLSDKRHRLPRELSGGEQQRVAIARALVMEPRYLFADEPTGSLDTQNGDIVMKIIADVNRDQKMTVVMVTHDPDFALQARRQIMLVDGMMAQDSLSGAKPK